MNASLDSASSQPQPRSHRYVSLSVTADQDSPPFLTQPLNRMNAALYPNLIGLFRRQTPGGFVPTTPNKSLHRTGSALFAPRQFARVPTPSQSVSFQSFDFYVSRVT